MRRVLVSLAVLIAASAHAQQPIAVDFESHHKIVFADQALRILEVVVPEGDETLDHAHQYDIVTVCIECAATRTRQPGGPWGDVRPRKAGGFLVAEYAGKPAAHAVRNVGKGFYRLVGVESLRVSGWQVAQPLDGQSGATLGQDTRAFRVYDIRLEASKGSVRHMHKLPTVVVLDTGDVTADSGTNEGAKRMVKPGEWMVVPAGGSHSLSAATGAAAHLVEVEVR